MANPYGRSIILPMTNQGGVGLIAGDVVIVDTAHDDSVTTTTSASSTAIGGIVQQTIGAGSVGLVCFGGKVDLVNVNASVTRGHYGATYTVAKQATDAGATRAAGTFLQFTTGGTTPKAIVYNPDLGGASLTNPMTHSQALIVGGSSGTPTELVVGAAGGALSVVNSAVAWNSGTSMPGSKATGDRYWRTDLGMEAYWDGTRWLSTQVFDSPLTVYDTSMTSGGFTVTAIPAIWTPWATTYDIYVIRFDGSLRVDSTNSGNDGSNFWTVTLQVGTSANSFSNLSGATMTTSAIAANVTTAFTSSPNTLWTPGTNPIGRTLATKTGTAGKLVYCANAIRYRLVLT